ncbi:MULTISPECIES: excalibur calcium-binding domain-containing protein [unclassified Stenotrophomonas]|uniref:excalibur calcium-binding domain-containing protein n=1 Tax=unclassified Stenotrophomonas TaxID=196198 RepID=UPI0010463BF8|nr:MULTISPECIES: excalibur calcium-binding domain-containing protein [unclassified Stenotrophomonas]MDV3514168.1 excalibur calcium-binding domain-containing protein [Stenotrophomonas sp. C1657]TDB35779.1 YHYH domain-containing protein [Stenotrophomonas sp. TEPEL]
MIALALPVEASAHSGGLDKNGCHTNRTTGDYHCHRGGPVAPRNFDAPRNNFTPGRARGSGAFANCAEARAAGAAPVRRGEPGYGPHLDRDNDGVGCEPYRGRR